MSKIIIPADAAGDILVCHEGLSFWGGVNGETGVVQDRLHPQHGASLAGRVVMMPTSRGSCSGSGLLLSLAMTGKAPAALIFREAEDILTLGAVIAARMFDRPLAVVRLGAEDYAALAGEPQAAITPDTIKAGALTIPLTPVSDAPLALSHSDHRMLTSHDGPAVQLAMEVLTTMARAQGAPRLIDVSRGHIDGCHYAGSGFLAFAERMLELGAKVRIPTTMNAISVDHANWRTQGVDPEFGAPAAWLADVYVAMGVAPSFTCAPYHLADRPTPGENIAWSESNAVVYANTVLGARSVKHPDFLDLCMAMTGRAPEAGVYLPEGRRPQRVVSVTRPEGADDTFWPLLGWLLGKAAPDRIPLVTGLEGVTPSEDDLRALCAAFGTTSAVPMLHIAGITPEADLPLAESIDRVEITQSEFLGAWRGFNEGDAQVDLVAIGSPHASADECRSFLKFLSDRKCNDDVPAIITLGRDVRAEIDRDGTAAALVEAGVTLVSDTCWCMITKPVFPPDTTAVMTNSGKYAHYGPGLSGCRVRFGAMAACAEAAVTGRAYIAPPGWMLD